MDKQAFLAVTLCAGIFLVWNQFYLKPYTAQQQAYQAQQAELHKQQQVTVPATETAKPAIPGEKAALGKPTTKAAEVQTVALGNDAFGLSISTRGGVVSAAHLAEYRGQKTSKMNRLVGGSDQLELSTTSPDWAYLSGVTYSVAKKDATSLVLNYDDANVTVQRTYALNAETYSLANDTTVKLKKPGPNYFIVGIKTLKHLPKDEMENERRELVLNRAGGQKNNAVADIDALTEDQAAVNWTGFSSRYFLNALVNRHATAKAQFQSRPAGVDEATAGLVYQVQGIETQIPVTYYFGPKDVDVLSKVGGHLQSAVDFGWFTVFAHPMLLALKWFYKYLHNFGLSIILLTVLVKVLTYPLTLKSMKSMKQMQRIQPQLQRLRERYKDDKERLNKEMLQLMKSNGYNPAAGCLPVFIQMPIFIALYNVLYGAIDLYGQPFFGWIHDLSAKDPFYVTPILLALMMFVQQKMTPNTAADPAQQRMMMMMPVVFGFMMLWLPSGLTLYMLVNSVVSVLQQVLINRSIGGGAAQPA